jgi:phosphoglycerate dehydrogenase-like enzyme
LAPAAILVLNDIKKVTAVERKQTRDFTPPGTGDPEGLLPTEWFGSDQLHEFLSKSDVVVICAPLTDATRNLISTDALKAMKQTAFLINIARGEIIDQPALVHALDNSIIAGASLDVMTPEPLPDDSQLLMAPNTILTPHVSGHTNLYNERVAELLRQNVQKYLDNRPLTNVVSKVKGY